MKGIFASICKFLVGAAILSGIAVFIIYSKLPSIVSHDLSNRFKVPVKVEEISIGLGSIEIEDFSIQNLPEKRLEKALVIKEIESSAPFTNYLKEKIVIDEIVANDIYLGLEFNSASSAEGNWTVLMDNYDATEPRKDNPSDGKEVLIKELILRDIHVEVVYEGKSGTHKLKPIKEIVLKNINTKKGFPADQIMRSALGEMLKSVFVQENLSDMLKEILKDPSNAENIILDPLKNLFK